MNHSGIGDRYRLEALKKTHFRKNFSCGIDALDDYFHKRASQDTKSLFQ